MENYREAAIRHLNDSEKLLESNSVDNAGHLIGFAAECAIKYKIELNNNDNPKMHFPYILAAAKKRLTGRESKSLFSVLSSKENVLKGWDINYRYYANGTMQSEEVSKWISQTKRIFAAAGIMSKK